MDIISFWGDKATESEPLIIRVPSDAVLYVNQITLGGPCANTTSLWVTSTYPRGEDADLYDDEDKESIEESSDDSEDIVKTETLAAGHLTWGRQESVRTKMVFGGGEKVKFTVEGDGEIHLVGHMSVEDLSVLGVDSDDEDYLYDEDADHAVVEAGDEIHIGSEDEEDEEIDSDEGETIYELIDADEDSEDSDFDGEDMVVEDGPLIEEVDTDDELDSDDDEEEERLDAREVRRLLLGDDAGDRPEEDSEDEDAAFDEEAFYAALARDEGDEDGEDADEAEMVVENRGRNNKKRAREGEMDGFLASPNGNNKKHKGKHAANGKHHGKKHHRRN